MRLMMLICAFAVATALSGGHGSARAESGCGESGSFAIDTFAPGDFNRDDDVDLADFNGFAACFNGPNLPSAEGCGVAADLDGDADVDLNDFQTFAQCFNGPNQPPACL